MSMDKNPTALWQAEVQCRQCKLRRWVPYGLRHAGTKKEQGVDGAKEVRCPHCRTGEDWTEWTGKRKEGVL